jgi:hypothetical protein
MKKVSMTREPSVQSVTARSSSRMSRWKRERVRTLERVGTRPNRWRPEVTAHRWSGWPGAWCLDCGAEDPVEVALAEGNFQEVTDDSEMGFHYEFPGVVVTECPEPGSKRFDPYDRGGKNVKQDNSV